MTVDNHLTAERYANALLRDLGISLPAHCASIHPVLRAAQCGLNALTGRAEGFAQFCPAPLAACADGVIAALHAMSLNEKLTRSELASLDGAALLCERAASFGYTRAGAISAGGSCRLLQAADGWLAINLARESDWELLPAWLEVDCSHDWQSLADALQHIAVETAILRGRLLGLALCAMSPAKKNESSWITRQRITPVSRALQSHEIKTPLVIDLSSLWAGPLCSHLLQMMGARVIKVESTRRLDGARFGEKIFFDLLNGNKESVALDFSSDSGRAQLRQLLLRADIVIEASRPRALRQMGIFAQEIIAKNPALTWISITGYGRDDPQANWVAFGDDAGVAAGLSQLLFDVMGEVLFCGDAIADPLTGMHAALAAWAGYMQGGGELIALSLHDVVSHCMDFDSAKDIHECYRDWKNILKQSGEQAAPPRVRKPAVAAKALGADTETVLAEFGIAC